MLNVNVTQVFNHFDTDLKIKKTQSKKTKTKTNKQKAIE
jgi:hypothetical protein